MTKDKKKDHQVAIFKIITASSLFDGHDAAINLFRRLFQNAGLEVVHIGHNRSVKQIVKTAIEEDAHAICISSYQGGHNEFFKYLIDLLKQQKRETIKVFGGGGGTILPHEIKQLEKYGVEKIYHPDEGRLIGLEGIIQDALSKMSPHSYNSIIKTVQNQLDENLSIEKNLIPQALSLIEEKRLSIPKNRNHRPTEPAILGVTGPGGAGKSSLVDEIILRFLNQSKTINIAVLAFDPSKKKTGGALLGDRIRMNSIYDQRVFFRSMATRESSCEIASVAEEAIELLKLCDFDLIIVETTGTGQADSKILQLADMALYVMTSEYGASSQLEKIDMIDFADCIAINKSDKLGALDALEDVRHAYSQAHNLPFNQKLKFPIFATIASQFNNQGVDLLFNHLTEKIQENNKSFLEINKIDTKKETKNVFEVIPQNRTYYLEEIVDIIKEYKEETKALEKQAHELYVLKESYAITNLQKLSSLIEEKEKNLTISNYLKEYQTLNQNYSKDYLVLNFGKKQIELPLFSYSLAETKIVKIARAKYTNYADQLRFLREENYPGYFPYTSGVFPLKNHQEDPKRQFAGEGSPFRTNKRFHYLCQNEKAKRLSTAFDSVTLYGEDPSKEPDIYGKIGNSGVSIATLDDMKELYKGFDLTDSLTSVSLTINGPAPIILAMFLNTAIDFSHQKDPKKDLQKVKDETLKTVRGTVQADILKEEQAQNTCIFSSKFSLKMMGDIQEYFIKKSVKNFYSVSISGYHIAEAGANPVTQLALTLANGFTYVEYYLSRGMDINDFAPNLSFFFSSGLDAEYSVIGRVARKIWAITLHKKYGASLKNSRLKYHIQTSGRSLHAQEIDFNDIRTTLQALMAYYDHCNSLHTNAYDEAITTPTEESVRRAMAIQMIIAKEMGVAKCENQLQGSFFYEELTELVEQAVLQEFESISRRGGVLGAMEKQYQRHKIQTESMKYETLKSSGELPIIGVNQFIAKESTDMYQSMEVIRADKEEKDLQIQRCETFIKDAKENNKKALQNLKQVIINGENIFEELMETVKYASLGQISSLLYQCGGEYRRSM